MVRVVKAVLQFKPAFVHEFVSFDERIPFFIQAHVTAYDLASGDRLKSAQVLQLWYEIPLQHINIMFVDFFVSSWMLVGLF